MIDETVIGNAIYMVERGHHDLRDLFRWMLKYLSDHPALIAELRAGRRPGRDPRLAEACVLETLRLDQAELLKRKAVESFDFEGFHVPKNSWIAILLRESHRDPRTFPSRTPSGRTASWSGPTPLTNTRRSASTSTSASLVHSSRRVGTLFVEELVNGFSWSVSEDGPRRHGHFHWEPSPSFAIEIRRDPQRQDQGIALN